MLTCEHCGTEFERRPRGPVARFCSANCRVASHRPKYLADGREAAWAATSRERNRKPATTRQCRECTEPFRSVSAANVMCSDTCRRRNNARRLAPLMHERRARIRGSESERFSPSEVFERDGFLCYLCGVLTDPEAPRYTPLKTTLDHVVPLRDGGAHTRANTRCACLRCNMRKGPKPLEEVTDRAGSCSEAI